jgi:dihydroxyacid dehydratase/phosphogluconate dehydratase
LFTGFQTTVFKGDSLIVISAFQQVSTCWQGFMQLLDDIKTKLNSFDFHDVAYSTRSQQSGSSNGQGSFIIVIQSQVWIEECPSFTQSIVITEQDFSIV